MKWILVVAIALLCGLSAGYIAGKIRARQRHLQEQAQAAQRHQQEQAQAAQRHQQELAQVEQRHRQEKAQAEQRRLQEQAQRAAEAAEAAAKRAAIPPWIGNIDLGFYKFYPAFDGVYIRSLEQTGDGFAMRIVLDSDWPGFAHFTYSVNDAPELTSDQRPLVLTWTGKRGAELDYRRLKIRAANKTGELSKQYELTLSFCPREYYTSRGQYPPTSYIILQSTNMIITSHGQAPAIQVAATPEDQKYAQKLWGTLIEGETRAYRKAQLVLQAIAKVVDNSEGVPSQRLETAAPFVQYELMAAGEEKGWCGNKAKILNAAMNALGIRSRHIGIGRGGTRMNDSEFLPGVGHSVIEIFDPGLNRWCWMDNSLNILEARMNGEGPMTLYDVAMAMEHPTFSKSLEIVRFKSSSGESITEKALESPLLPDLRAYFNRRQEFQFK